MRISNAFAKSSKLSGVLLIALLLMTASVPAQTPVDAEPPEMEEAPMPTIENEEKPASAMPADKSATASTDPCPLPSAELAKTPDNLAKIQSDIDRYTLCMERAQLLQRLNSVALENQQALNQSSGMGLEGMGAQSPGMQLGGGNLPDFNQQRQQIMASVDSAALNDPKTVTAEPPPEDKDWMIMKILGAGGQLSAQLGKTDGTLAQVRTGDALPDGSTVNSISSTAVAITQEGERKNLRWRDDGGSSTGSGS